MRSVVPPDFMSAVVTVSRATGGLTAEHRQEFVPSIKRENQVNPTRDFLRGRQSLRVSERGRGQAATTSAHPSPDTLARLLPLNFHSTATWVCRARAELAPLFSTCENTQFRLQPISAR
jgi:hypothetical protein